MPRLVIFDCDGVLVDSEPIANRIDAEALTKAGFPISAEENIRRFTGMSQATARALILRESGITIPADYFAEYHPLLMQAYENELIPLMTPVLESLRLANVQRCVASSSPRQRVLRCLQITDQFQYFDESSVFTAQQVVNGKPAPDLFLFAAKQMGFDPADCMVIEDSVAGIQAALSAKMEVIAFLGGGHTAPVWYQEKIQSLGVPVVHNCAALIEKLSV